MAQGWIGGGPATAVADPAERALRAPSLAVDRCGPGEATAALAGLVRAAAGS